MERPVFVPNRPRSLPPVILHPFTNRSGAERLATSARASLILRGLIPAEGLEPRDLDDRLLEGRFCEIQMLFYLGKDLARWIEQCIEVVGRDEELCLSGIRGESFASMLVNEAPAAVQEKLGNWGVADFGAIFRRALGLHAAFGILPGRESLTDGFIRNHHMFADTLYETWMSLARPPRVRPEDFPFDLYASGEYARMLEVEWEPRGDLGSR
jgi:hypothetical protein